MDNHIKPTDPEPLECWGFKSPAGVFNGYLRKQDAEGMDNMPIHMREVTPQDEKDQEDAARFRGLQQLCRFHTTTWSKLEHTPVERWRELIDKAMEGGDA